MDNAFDIRDYYEIARQNEKVFRNVLRDLRDNRAERPMGRLVPEDLETELSLDEIFQECSEGKRDWKFTIVSFSRPEETKAIIHFKYVAPLTGGSAELEYLVNPDDSVEYKEDDPRILH